MVRETVIPCCDRCSGGIGCFIYSEGKETCVGSYNEGCVELHHCINCKNLDGDHKGDSCSKCRNFYCCGCYQNSGIIHYDNWYCDDCGEDLSISEEYF
jgi:hypothetical protein